MNEPARVGVIASQEVTEIIQIVLNRHGQVAPLVWPVADPSLIEAPDLIVCEIEDHSQAAAFHGEIKKYWPEATVVSFENQMPSATDIGVGSLLGASRAAGYLGHLNIDDAALQLPIFLRYAEQRRVADQRAHQIVHLKRLLSASVRMQASLDRPTVAQAILSECGQWVNADNWQLYAVSDDRKFIELLGTEGVRIKPLSLTLMMDGDGIIERILESGEQLVLPLQRLELTDDEFEAENASDSRNVSQAHSAGDVGSDIINDGRKDLGKDAGPEPGNPEGVVLHLPLVSDDQVIGVVLATRMAADAVFTREETSRLLRISPFAASALKNATKFACAERLYMQDDLTTLRNSRFLRQFLDNEFRRVRRYGGQVAVIFIDLDGFKEVNDQHGHRVGSETLKVTAGLLLESVRDTDVVTRYGGDEFTIILPNTSADNAVVTAERIRQKLADHVFSDGDKTFRLTASFGIAAYPDCAAQSYVDLLEKADFAMYEAKADHKNNVKLASS